MVSFLLVIGMLYSPSHHTQAQHVRINAAELAPRIQAVIAVEPVPAPVFVLQHTLYTTLIEAPSAFDLPTIQEPALPIYAADDPDEAVTVTLAARPTQLAPATTTVVPDEPTAIVPTEPARVVASPAPAPAVPTTNVADAAPQTEPDANISPAAEVPVLLTPPAAAQPAVAEDAAPTTEAAALVVVTPDDSAPAAVAAVAAPAALAAPVLTTDVVAEDDASATPVTSGGSSDMTAEEAGLVALINQDRADHGLPPVVVDPTLNLLARAHSEDMAARNYFDHFAPAPGPSSPMQRYIAQLGYRPLFAMVGENIYFRSVTDEPDRTQNQAETAFMNSPGHRANILQPRYTKVGVGFYRGDDGQYWVTEMFLRDQP